MLRAFTTKKKKNNTRKLLEVMAMFTVVMGSLIVVIVSWVCAYAQTHQTVHNKYVQLTVYQLNFNIAVFKQEMENS